MWTADGERVLRLVTEPSVGMDALRDHASFDPDRVCVEVVDTEPGTAPHDVTLKRFPPWGDATDLIDLLDVRADGDGRFIGGVHSDGRRPVVEASQMLGQAIVAASRHAPERRAVSAELVVVRPADARRPLAFELEELSAGRTFTGLTARVLQDGRRCAAGTLLLDATAPTLIEHAADPPAVPGPYDCTPHDMAVTGQRTSGSSTTPTPTTPMRPPVHRCSTAGSASAAFPPTRRCTPGSWPNSPGTCRSPRRFAPTPVSVRTRHTGRCRWGSTPSTSPFIARSAPTAGCSTTIVRPSPVTA